MTGDRRVAGGFLLFAVAQIIAAAAAGYAFGGTAGAALAGVAVAIPALCAAVHVAVCLRSRSAGPTARMAAVLLGSGVKVFAVLALCAFVLFTTKAFQRPTFGAWVVGGYFVNLVAATLVLVRRLAEAPPPPPNTRRPPPRPET